MPDSAPPPAEFPIAGPVPTHGATEAIHIGESDLPFVDLGDGTSIQVLQIDLAQGLWILKTRFEPGVQVAKHYHTGPVFAVTLSGTWHYKEYPQYKNTKGSYLFEPAGSVHTLVVPEDQDAPTEVWFAIYGCNVNIDETGNVTSIVSAEMVLSFYRELCAAAGHPDPKVIVLGGEIVAS
jgi:quercetin dioxygenase-like cupin family protein